LQVLKNNGSAKTQPPCFVKLKLLKVALRCDSTISSEEVRGMVNDLLQNSLQTRVDIFKEVLSFNIRNSVLILKNTLFLLHIYILFYYERN
jgi:hypothetical protein